MGEAPQMFSIEDRAGSVRKWVREPRMGQRTALTIFTKGTVSGPVPID